MIGWLRVLVRKKPSAVASTCSCIYIDIQVHISVYIHGLYIGVYIQVYTCVHVHYLAIPRRLL
ncbi:hypothetical protein BGW36DRAFT_377367 [Talaromyces proteolyticus]|uniref:Uncharacterized protein n=1 Tax=Talaromyces proteolyticus TaxID=1131652 RepID=A0AAD4Q235_9EURO|nr:uncharacterized protein BGW36DRAFT_377367 [Talaromyces proteolyticus]KAH8699150.1 hypothetical protein BGW36DRAFT_377367 [Talaromyces proteolyticus]